MANKVIPHGVYLRLGPLPMGMCWDIEMARWGNWPTGISYEDHLAVQACRSDTEEAPKKVNTEAETVQEKPQFNVAEELHRVPKFMLTLKGVNYEVL